MKGDLRGVINCFCGQCRKTSGHHVAATQVLVQNFAFDKKDTLKWFRSSVGAQRGFCAECGGNLFWQTDNSDAISVMAGTIDKPTGLSTIENIFIEEMSDYHAEPALTQ
jgi:hypothetical protein